MTQDTRIVSLCEHLKLDEMKVNFTHLAQEAATHQKSFSDYLESLLQVEVQGRQARTQHMLVKTAGFPGIKTVDDYDFKFAVGAPKK